MTSAINPSIDVSYPLPGQNNSSQGFRDNFTAINTAFTTAATEISDLQSKVLLKSALTGTTLNNDMNNNLILNAQTLGFRASTYNLGTNLVGTVIVDCTLGDVQYGTIQPGTGALSLTFSKWAPSGTQASVQVILSVSPGDVITLPDTILYGLDTIEGFNGLSSIVIPTDTTRVHYVFNTLDCGTTIEIVPVDHPRTGSVSAYGDANVLILLSNVGNNVIKTTSSVDAEKLFVSNIANIANLNVSATANLGNVANVKIGGVGTGFFLRNDGNGNVSWASTPTSNSNISGTLNSIVVVDSTGHGSGTANLTYASNTMAVVGNVNASGNISGNNFTAANTITANSFILSNANVQGNNINAVNSVTTNNIIVNNNAVINSNATVGINLSVAGVANITGNINSNGNIVTKFNSSVGGTLTAGAIFSNGAIIGSNIDVSNANVTTLKVTNGANLGSINNLYISGGTNGYVLTTNGSGSLSWTIPGASSFDGNLGFNPTFLGNLGSTNGNIKLTGGRIDTNVLSVTGQANIGGNLSIGNLVSSGQFASIAGNTTISGNLIINGATANVKDLNVSGNTQLNGNITANNMTANYFYGTPIIEDNPIPATATTPGIKGQIVFGTDYLYVCIAGDGITGTWKRTALSTW